MPALLLSHLAVFYEELVDRPEAVLRQLLSACGLPWDPRVLHFHKTERPVQTASMEQVGAKNLGRILSRVVEAWSTVGYYVTDLLLPAPPAQHNKHEMSACTGIRVEAEYAPLGLLAVL